MGEDAAKSHRTNGAGFILPEILPAVVISARCCGGADPVVKNLPSREIIALPLGFFLSAVCSICAEVALVRHAPALNGRVAGSRQVMLPENVALNAGATVAADLLILGTATVQINGQPTSAALQMGKASPVRAYQCQAKR